MSGKVNTYNQILDQDSLNRRVSMILNQVMLCHLNREGVYQKFCFLCMMARHLYSSKQGLDNKDQLDFKRIETSGSLLSLLFEDLFKKYNKELQKELELKFSRKYFSVKELDLTKMMLNNSIGQGLINSISSGNWTIKRFRIERKGVSQLLNRISYYSSLSTMAKIESYIEKSKKISGPRSLIASHYGYYCPSDTPDGDGCGLVKTLAITCEISISFDVD